MVRSTLSIAVSIALLTACGGGSDGGSSNPAPVDENQVQIAVIDGRLKNALVCIDANQDQACSTTEYKINTDENGIATLTRDQLPEQAYLIAQATANQTEDLDRGMVGHSFVMMAPEGATVISPFTDAMIKFTDDGQTIEQARELLVQALSQYNNDLEQLESLVDSDFTQLDSYSARVMARMAEIIVDTYRTSNYRGATLEQLLAGLSGAFAGIDANDIGSFSPTITQTDDGFVFEDNHRPQPQSSQIAPQTIDFGQAINSIELAPLFDDADGDVLSYRMLTPLSGLSIVGGVLQGTPQVEFDGRLQIVASDGKADSSPVYFELKVGEATQPEPQPARSITGVAYAGEIAEDEGYITANQYGFYYWIFNYSIETLDVVLNRNDGTKSTYSFDTTEFGGTEWFENVRIDSQYVNSDKYIDNGWFYLPLSRPIAKGDNLYFAAKLGENDDGSVHYQDWQISFSNDGKPVFTKTEFDAPICSDVKDTLQDCDARELFHANRNQADGDNSDDIKYWDYTWGEHTLYFDGQWYTLADNDGAGIALIRYDSERQQHDYEIVLQSSGGLPVREVESVSLRYNPKTNAIYFVGEVDMGNVDTYLVGEYSLATQNLNYTTYGIGDYHDDVGAVALADDGIFLIHDDHGHPRHYSGAANQITTLENIDMPNSRIPSMQADAYMQPNGNFYVIEDILYALEPHNVLKFTVN